MTLCNKKIVNLFNFIFTTEEKKSYDFTRINPIIELDRQSLIEHMGVGVLK